MLLTVRYASHTEWRMGGTRPRNAQNSGAVFSLKYHVGWCPKYRRQVLVPPVDTRLKTIIGAVAAEYGFTVPRDGGDARPRSPLHRGRPDALRRRDSQQIQGQN